MRRHVTSCLFATGLCLSLAPVAGGAAKRSDAIHMQTESALLVSGTIDITAEGTVLGYALDNVKTLPPGIVDMTARLAPHWRFEPTTLPPGTISRTKMNLHYIAKRHENGDYQVELRNASFFVDQPPEQRVTVARRGRRPEYPPMLQAMEVNGTVYLSVQIGRDGKVMNIDASHVNLRTVGSEAEMADWRKQFAEACIKAVRSWTFKPPTVGEEASAPYWVGTLPAEFNVGGFYRVPPGKWETYMPGPRKPIPWVDSLGTTADNSDALTPNEFHTNGSGRRLISPLTGS
jgi:enamine deaminase RidA (YjgF/YER057c/UK114 family)